MKRRMRRLAKTGTVTVSMSLHGYDEIEVWEACLIRRTGTAVSAVGFSPRSAVKRLAEKVDR